MLISCKKQEVNEPTEPDLPFLIPTVEVKGSIILPKTEDVSKLKIVAGFHEGQISTTKSSNVELFFKIPIIEGKVQLITVVNETKPLLYCIADGQGGVTIMSIDSSSTAETMAFMNYPLFTTDKNLALQNRQYIRNSSDFPKLCTEIGQALRNGTFAIDGQNLQFLDNVVNAAYTSMMGTQTIPPQISQNNGYEFKNSGVSQQASGKELNFEVTNKKFRYAKVFIDKYKNGNLISSVPTDDADVLTNLVESPAIDWSSLVDWIRKNQNPLEKSRTFNTNVDNIDKIDVKCYSFGFRNMPTNEKDRLRMIVPTAHTLFHNFALPMSEIITGLDIANNLKGRPNSQAHIKIMKEIILGLTEPTFSSQVATAINAGNSDAEIVKMYAYKTLSIVLDNEKLLYDLVKDVFGDKIGKGVFKQFLKVVPIYKLFSLGMTSFNLGVSTGTMVSSDSMTTFSVYPNIPTNGLVAYYPFNGNANDESGNGNHGTVNGAVLATDRKGNSNKAYSFNRNSIVTNSNVITSLPYTISGWFKKEGTGTGFAKYGILFSTSSVIHGYRGNGIWAFTNESSLAFQKGPLDQAGMGGAHPNNTNWHHFSVVCENTLANNSLKLYLDGVVISSNKNVNLTYSGSSPLTFGRGFDSTIDFSFIGLLDDFRIYNRALVDGEIQTLYQE